MISFPLIPRPAASLHAAAHFQGGKTPSNLKWRFSFRPHTNRRGGTTAVPPVFNPTETYSPAYSLGAAIPTGLYHLAQGSSLLATLG